MNPSTPPAPAGRNPWPIAIVSYFIIFIAFIAWFITFAMRQKMDLVRDDYYDQEIRFQQQIDRVQRTQSISTPRGVPRARCSFTGLPTPAWTVNLPCK